MNDLYTASDLELHTGIEFFIEPLGNLLGDVLDRLKVSDFVVVEDDGGQIVSIVLAVEDDLFLQIPGLEGFGLGIIVESQDEWPLIYCEVITGDAGHSLSVQHFPLRIEIANPLLRPVAIEDQARVLGGFSFEIEGGFTVASDLSLSATLDSFSIPPFEIVGTGLVLALTDCRLIISEDDVDNSITELGFDIGFRGLHAGAALFDWDLPLQLEGHDLPGIHALLNDIALGNQGLSAAVQLSWPVAFQNGDFDAAQTEMSGYLIDPSWSCALSVLNLTIQANIPQAVGASGFVRLPYLGAIFGLDLFLSYAAEGEYETRMALSLGESETIDFPLGHPDYSLQISALSLSGSLSDGDTLEVAGETALSIDLPGMTLAVGTVAMRLQHDEQGERYELELQQVEIDTLGTLEQALLKIDVQRDAEDQRSLAGFELQAQAEWADLSSRISLNQLPDAFPLPPDDAEVTIKVRWVDDEMLLSIEATLEDVDQLWRFIPAAQRPEVAEASIRIHLTVEGADFEGEGALAIRFRLPDVTALPGLAAAGLDQLVQVDTGDEDGWIEAEFKAAIDSDSGDPSGSLAASLQAPVALAFNLPGLILPQPPLELSIDSIELELSGDERTLEGEFRLAGEFALRPILPSDLGGLVPAPMALQLERLLSAAHLYDLAGASELRLGQSEDGAYLSIDCSFENAGIEVDLFDMLAGVTTHLGASGTGGSEIDLDIEVSFALQGLSLSVGRIPDSEQEADGSIPFSFGLTAELGFAGHSTTLEFALSSEALRFGFSALSIPLMIPQLPISRTDLDLLRDADGDWDLAIWQQQIEPPLDQRLGEAEIALEAARAELQALDNGEIDDDEQLWYELKYRTIPSLRKYILHLTGKKFLNEAVLAVHQLLGQLSTPASQASYQQMVEVYQDAVDLTLGWVKFDTGLQFEIADAMFVLPFNDPSDIRVAGSASLKGFAPESPLRPLADLEFTLGLSADAIFFAVEGGADPIPLPDFGRYPGSGVILDHLSIGYGYSKNSLKIDFAGELQLSPQLVDDLDSSQRLGAGVRLPTNNKLKFKLDLIPIVLGEVDFLLPLIAFDIDLRSDNPALPATGTPCTPTWDGLQFIAPGVVHADIKRAKFSPFFGPLPAPNYLYSFDFDIGNEQLGISHVCDDYQIIMPVLANIPIPFLADYSPYFDRNCTNLRIAGFGINFDLRRPFPHPSPLMIFELMGFLSDPSLPIDPAGHLANLMWAEIRNGRITLPPAVLGLFPEKGQAINRELDTRINVGTLIAFGQHLGDTLQQLQARLAEAGGDMADALEAVVNDPPAFNIHALLELLPRELRRVELQGGFVGFEASAVFLLTSPAEMLKGLSPSPDTPPDESIHWSTVVDEGFAGRSLNGWRAINIGLKRGQGDWAIEQQALVQRNNVGDNSAGRYGAMLIRETGPLSDIRVSVDMRSTDNDGMGVVFHVQGDSTFYRFRITAEQGEWQLMRLKRGRTLMLQSTKTAFTPGKDYHIRVESRSVPQSGATLPLSLTTRPSRRSPADLGLSTRELARVSTHIRIWVNDSLWCDLADSDKPLTEGEVGLDSWWNLGARFDNFKVERAERGALALSRAASLAGSRDLVPLTARASSNILPAAANTGWAADDLADFNDADLHAALSGVSTSAVVVAARVQILDNQVYRFIGVMQADGGFKLLTTAQVAPLRLAVAGIDLAIELQASGRLTLDGQAAGADSWARIGAELYGEWSLLSDANGPLATLRIGSEAEPVGFSLGSRGDFHVHGDGALHLFDGQILIDGSLDLSEQHVFVSGHLDFSPDWFVVSQQRLFELSLNTEGRLGPGRQFELSGDGSLQLFGRACSEVSGRVSQSGLSLQARIAQGGQPWGINGFELTNAELAVRGEVHFGSTPALSLEGTGQLDLNGARIDGQASISAGAGDWCIGMAGKLHWQGRDWMQGAIELCRDRLTVQGQTSFALNLTPTQLPANIQIAGLYLTATVGGSFTVRASQRLKACAFHIDWTLSIRLPGGHAQQMLPIATQQLRVEHTSIASAPSVDLIDLINIDGWKLLPLDGITLPIPQISDDRVNIYLHDSVTIDPPAVTLPVPLITTSQPAGSSPPDPVFTVPLTGISFYVDSPEIDVPGFELPIPALSTEAPDNNTDPLLSLPSIDVEEVALGDGIRLDQLTLGLKLAWKDGELGIKVIQTGQFHAFGSLPPFQFIIGTLLPSITQPS